MIYTKFSFRIFRTRGKFTGFSTSNNQQRCFELNDEKTSISIDNIEPQTYKESSEKFRIEVDFCKAGDLNFFFIEASIAVPVAGSIVTRVAAMLLYQGPCCCAKGHV